MLSTARNGSKNRATAAGYRAKTSQPVKRRRLLAFSRVSFALELAIGFRGILAAGISSVGFSGGVLGQIIAGNRR